MTEHTPILRLQRDLVWWFGVERRLASWSMGWTIVVLAAFAARAFSAVEWWHVAAACAVHEAMFVMLLCVNGHRHRLNHRRMDLESRL